jgi:hypothetical protein
MNANRLVLLLVVLAGLVPFYFQPMRVEPNEPARAGLIGVIALFAVALLWTDARRSVRRAAWALVALAALILLGGVLALSPTTGVMGEFVRRYGALTQLALLAGALIGAFVYARYGGGGLARVLWLAGVVIGVVALIQQARYYPTNSPTYYPVRSSSLIGYPTYLGGWVALAVVACAAYAPLRQRWWRQIIWWAGVALCASALIPAGARTATLALAAGVGTLVLAAAAARRWRWIIALVVVGGVAAALVLPRLVGMEGIPLFQRLALDVQGNATQDLRIFMWERALWISAAFPTLTSLTGQPDALAALRPLIGYGADMQESVYGLFPLVDGYSFDRAHNGWLELLLTGGWLNLLARLALLIAGAAWALHRLRLLRLTVVAPVAAALIAAAWLIASRDGLIAWTPVILTLAAVAGLYVGLLLYLLLPGERPAEPLDRAALTLLAALVAFVIDMQLGFETVAVMFTFWLVCGGAFARREGDERLPALVWVALAAFGGALLLRAFAFNAPTLASAQISAALTLPVLLIGVIYLLWLDRCRWRIRSLLAGVALIAAAWVWGASGAYWSQPFAAAAWDVLLVLLACVVLLRVRRRPAAVRQRGLLLRAAAVVLMIGALALWWVDTAGDIALRRGAIFAGNLPPDDFTMLGARLRFWDARVWVHLATKLISSGDLDAAETALAQAARLHPFHVWGRHLD